MSWWVVWLWITPFTVAGQRWIFTILPPPNQFLGLHRSAHERQKYGEVSPLLLLRKIHSTDLGAEFCLG